MAQAQTLQDETLRAETLATTTLRAETLQVETLQAEALQARSLQAKPAKALAAPVHPKPEWLKVRPPAGQKYLQIKSLLKSLNLATVCQEARCPNMAECWGGGTATVMLMGDVCTRGCRFCSVKTGNPRGRLDAQEPEKVGHAVASMGLDYVVLTSVDRDDLPDEGAGHFARTVQVIKEQKPDLLVEVLTPDFKGRHELVDVILQSAPDVFAHNVETVESLQHRVRDPRAGYRQSLNVLKWAKSKAVITKTSLMLGLGESSDELKKTLSDLRAVGCDVVTFGQYLQPTKLKLKVQKFYSPQEFKYWQQVAESMGFLYVASGPLVRSSYRAGELFIKNVLHGKHAVV